MRISYVFGLFYNEHLIGAMVYGPLGMANTWKKYGDCENDVVELVVYCYILQSVLRLFHWKNFTLVKEKL